MIDIAVGSAWRRKGSPYAPRMVVSSVLNEFVYAHLEGEPPDPHPWTRDQLLGLFEPESPEQSAEQTRFDAEDAALAGICTKAAV